MREGNGGVGKGWREGRKEKVMKSDSINTLEHPLTIEASVVVQCGLYLLER